MDALRVHFRMSPDGDALMKWIEQFCKRLGDIPYEDWPAGLQELTRKIREGMPPPDLFDFDTHVSAANGDFMVVLHPTDELLGFASAMRAWNRQLKLLP